MNIKYKKKKKNEIKIYVFTCVKNGRNYVKKLFDSMLAQTCTSFVHYIYDNGSDDPIDDLVAQYKEKAKNLRTPFEVIYEKTEKIIGLNMATKHCIDRCDKPYFIWIDCDNWIGKDFFKYLIKTIKRHPNNILYRTLLVKVDGETGNTSSNYKERRLSVKNQNNAAFTFFTRKNRYYYSFFAKNMKKFSGLKALASNMASSTHYLQRFL